MTELRSGFSRIWQVLCLGLTLMILWLALMPSASAPSGLGWDKLNHAGAIAVASGFAFLAMQARRWAAPAAFLYGVILGILIEILQATLTTSRSAEWGDLAADCIGAGATWCIIRIYQRRIAAKQ